MYNVFDNGGETCDRYTVIDKHGDMLGLSNDTTHPLGFSQFCGNIVDNYMIPSYGASWRRHCNVDKIIKQERPRLVKEFETNGNIGKKIKFSELPDNIKLHIKSRFENED